MPKYKKQEIIQAIKQNKVDYIKHIPSSDDLLKVVDEEGNNLAQIALKSKAQDVLDILLVKNSDFLDLNKGLDHAGNSLAHFAISVPWAVGLKKILERQKEFLNLPNKQGEYLLDRAVVNIPPNKPTNYLGINGKEVEDYDEQISILRYLLDDPAVTHFNKTNQKCQKTLGLTSSINPDIQALFKQRQSKEDFHARSAKIKNSVNLKQEVMSPKSMPLNSKIVIKQKGDNSWVGALVGMLFLYPWMTMLMAMLFAFIDASLVVGMAHLGGVGGLFFGALIGIAVWKLAGVENTSAWMIGMIIGGFLGLSLGLLICNVLAPGIGWIWGPLITGMLDAVGMLLFGIAGKLIAMAFASENDDEPLSSSMSHGFTRGQDPVSYLNNKNNLLENHYSDENNYLESFVSFAGPTSASDYQKGQKGAAGDSSGAGFRCDGTTSGSGWSHNRTLNISSGS